MSQVFYALAFTLLCLQCSAEDDSFITSTLVNGNIVYYKIDPSFGQHETDYIKARLSDVESSTCLEFKAHDSKALTELIEFLPSDSERCQTERSFTGSTKITVSDRCFFDQAVLHEVLYALGFENEHRRRDRDCYVEIHGSKLNDPEYSLDFNSSIAAFPYDVHSVMHYRRNYGTYLRPAESFPNQDEQFGSKDVLSEMDVMKLNYQFCGGDAYCTVHQVECDETLKRNQNKGCVHSH